MNAVPNSLNRLVAAGALLLLCGLSGCTCNVACESGCVFDGYAAWPCYGYHSTCWRPWPGECINCPSPFAPIEVPPGEPVPAPIESPIPMPIPEAAPPVQPAAPPAPTSNEDLLESSSRRRAVEGQVQYLETLRWAPTDSR